MAWVVERASGNKRFLEAEHLVGRGSGSSLRITHRYVSAQHALVLWNGDHWEVKDLGSRNGTFLDGIRIRAGDHVPLRVGARLGFGLIEQEWVLTEDGPPTPMAVPVDGGDPVLSQGDLIVLPSPEDPQVSLFRNSEGSWMLEKPDDSSAPISSFQTFEVQGRTYRFCCPQLLPRTSIAELVHESAVRNVRLVFSVSRDEEHVQVQATCASRTHDLGARSRHYLLLTLARRRLADAAEGLPDTSCGWIHQDELSRDPTMSGPQLNIDVFRIRQQFGELNITDPASIIERRPRTRELRIGTSRLTVVTL